MPMPTMSAAAAASHGARDVNPRVAETGTCVLKCESSMTVHIASRGGSGGGLKLRGNSPSTSSMRSSSIILLLECSQLFSQLRSCRGEPALARPFRDAEDAGDFRVRVSFNVVQNQRRAISF